VDECTRRKRPRAAGDERRLPRELDLHAFRRAYDRLIVGGRWNEEPDYYPRYRSRYQMLLERYAREMGPAPIDVLEVGGGQHALLAKELWNDRAAVADLGGPQLDTLRANGVETMTWDLCSEAQPAVARFDAIFFCEVIEHLPIPGHVALGRLRRALRPGGRIVISTPNLYRLRNVVYLAAGIPIFDYFRMPEERGLGHVLEYSSDHLRWQMEKAGFRDCAIELRQAAHAPTRLVPRVLSWIGYPLFLVPRFRDNLVAVATAPA
jgi:SAM-dependent methyltransferase